MKSKVVSMAVAMAAAFGMVNAALASPTMTLSIQYVGSGMASDASGAFDGSTAASLFNSGLTQHDLTLPATQATPGLVNIFQAYLKYTPNGTPATDLFGGESWTVQFGPGMRGSAPDGSAAGSSAGLGIPLYYDSVTGNSTMLTQNGPASGANDLDGITTAVGTNWSTIKAQKFGTASQPKTVIPYDSILGTPIGFFGMAFTGDLVQDTPSLVTAINPYGSGSAYYFPSAGTTMPDFAFDVNQVSGSVPLTVFAAAPIPEPASLGVLALGGLALLARRRKVA